MLKNIKKNIKKGLFTKKYILISLPLLVALILFILELTSTINFIGKSGGNDSTIISLGNNPNTTSIDYGPTKPEDFFLSPEKSNAVEASKVQSPGLEREISVLITHASRNSVGVFIEKIDIGDCKLSVTQSGFEKISMETSVLQERDYSTCQGFDIDSSKLDSAPIIIKVTVTSENRTGIAEQEVK